MQDLFTYTFPLDEKIKPLEAGVSENGRKNGFHWPENQFSLARIDYFSKIGLPLAEKKSPNKGIIFQVDRKSVSTSRNGEFV